MKHTKEPWNKDSYLTFPRVSQGRIALEPEDFERAVNCVNALAGIDNPKEWVEWKKAQTYEIENLTLEITRLKTHIKDLLEVELPRERNYGYRLKTCLEKVKRCIDKGLPVTFIGDALKQFES